MRTVYLGWDPNELQAYNVAAYSILRRVSRPIDVRPLKLANLGHLLTRPIERRDGRLWCPISEAPMSTEFAISRFCVPFLRLAGWSLFADSDIVCLADIHELFDLADPRYAVMCVKHNHRPETATKKVDQVQQPYSRKNWSSVMLFNHSHLGNSRLTGERLNSWPGRDLHAFKWLEDSEIGELPGEWNHLVDCQPTDRAAKLLHFTLGGPYLSGWKGGSCDRVWQEEAACLAQSSGS